METYFTVIYTNASGEFAGFEAYGPLTIHEIDATRFTNRAAAEYAIKHRFGICGSAFWEGERKAAEIARKRHAGWRSHIQEHIKEGV